MIITLRPDHELTPEAEAALVPPDIHALLAGEVERSVCERRVARRWREKARVTLKATRDIARAEFANFDAFPFLEPQT
ncbi:hypothetical protein [Caballeronia arationis]|uniref:hypothetical protein n=1 Tax=Caballeronia arationis TaxID=1777142 RepID=UPI0007893446|nr:hypothetical protein [Caballeronia arationis]